MVLKIVNVKEKFELNVKKDRIRLKMELIFWFLL